MSPLAINEIMWNISCLHSDVSELTLYLRSKSRELNMLQRILLLWVATVFIGIRALSAQEHNSIIYQGNAGWANSKLSDMDLDEKLGQLFMVAAYSNKGEAHRKEILKLVKDEHIGGLIFFQGGPQRQAQLTNLYQQNASIPLMIGMDAEWGLAMRLDSTFKFPWPLTVGATRDSGLAYAMGREIARHCKRLGVHINFGPVVDLNTNPDNPIINARSFGEDRENVTRLAQAYMQGMQDQRIMASAKHFPGHGDTDSDSHKTLPTVGHPMERLRSTELYPYQHLIDNGLASVMVAHLNVPAMDASGMPSSLSHKIVKEYLQDSLHFDGLAFTDALNMQGVASRFSPGEVDALALLAGNDVLLFAQDVPVAKERIKQAIKEGKISEEEIDRRVHKVLLAKSWLGLEQKKHVEPGSIEDDLLPPSSLVVNRRIYEQAITVLLNKEKVIPVKELKGKKIAVVNAGTDPGYTFTNVLKKYADVHSFNFVDGVSTNELLNQLAGYDLVIMGIYTSNASPWKSYKIPADIQRFVRRLTLQNKTIISVFGNPYSLRNFSEAEQADGLLMAYQNHSDAESIAAQVIFGAIGAKGRLPVSAGPVFQEGFGLQTESLNRLGYGLPAEVDLDAAELDKIDLLVREAINEKATPGCQIIIARRGKVIFDRAYGHHTYDKSQAVRDDDLYDLASITKVAATLPILMKLVEENKLELDATLGEYLPELKGTNKEDLVIRDILAHQARLQPWIPFYLETLQDGMYLPGYYAEARDFDHPNVVADHLFSTRFVKDTIVKTIYASDLLKEKEYRYSDLGYYIFMDLIEELMGKDINEVVDEWLYSSLGAYTLTYQPLLKFNQRRIVPTEDDQAFRKQALRGYVHDQGAAMLGGVAGHAGLFSSANDLAKLMQMYLNGGSYGGVRYLDSITLKEFTRCQFCDDDNRRGIGFDKPQLEGPGPTCGCVSPLSFGHTGFTGTIAWADPAEEIVYIFLSNRVHPDASNRKLLTLSTRTRIQKVIYNSIKDESEDSNRTIIGFRP